MPDFSFLEDDDDGEEKLIRIVTSRPRRRAKSGPSFTQQLDEAGNILNGCGTAFIKLGCGIIMLGFALVFLMGVLASIRQ
jgi:hypothetical protein